MWQNFELSEIFAIPSSKHYMNYGIATVSCVDIVPIHIEFFVTIFQERNTANDMWQETVQELDRLAAEHRVCSFNS